MLELPRWNYYPDSPRLPYSYIYIHVTKSDMVCPFQLDWFMVRQAKSDHIISCAIFESHSTSHTKIDDLLCTSARQVHKFLCKWWELYMLPQSFIRHVARMLTSQFLSILLQCCHNRLPTSSFISTAAITIQPSVEDFSTCLLAAVAVISLHDANQALLHSKAAS